MAWGSVCKATHKDVAHLQSNQEEADTKMTLHALDATANAATQRQIHSPDTDVFVLALRRYPELCENTLFVTGRGQHHRIIELKPIAETLGPEKIAALPAFHALSGADNTGSFSGKEKLLCWKMFADADSSIITALAELPPAPEAILQLVQCGCSKERCSTNRCQCRKAGLNCTDLCNCSDNGETCDNDVQEEDVLYSDEEDSSDSKMYIHE